MTTEKDINNNDDNQFNEKYDEKLMDHDYDGIQELDNPAPAWIMAIFYITITFAVFYGAYYFWFGQGPNQVEEYEAMNAAHNEKYKNNEISGVNIFATKCASCHGANAEGSFGPNLTDNAWINGCGTDAVVKIITEGKTSKGMTAFKGQLSDEAITKVAEYILTDLKGTNPANAKEAEGEECK